MDNQRRSLKDRLQVNLEDIEKFDDLRRYLDVQSADWDAFLITDGSATTWAREMGWASILIRNGTFQRHVFYGGGSNGSNNTAEVMAVFHALMFLVENGAGVQEGGFRLHVVSDSQYVVRGLSHHDPVWVSQLKKNRMLWLGIHGARRQGIVVRGHFIPRDQVELNRYCHDLANAARRNQIQIAKEQQKDVYQCNPS